MIKTLLAPFITLITSGVLWHRSSFVGILCGIWIYFGTDKEASTFSRILTPDLYLFMLSFLILYRLILKKVEMKDGEIDLKVTGIYLLGDFARAVLTMICAAFFFLSFGVSTDTDDLENVGAAIENEAKNLPPQVRGQVKREIKKYIPF